MTKASAHSFSRLSGSRRNARLRLALALTGAAALAAGVATALPGIASASTATTAEPYNCAPNGPAGSQTVYGTFGDASVIGWAGNSQGVVACLGGSFWVDTSGRTAGRAAPARRP